MRIGRGTTGASSRRTRSPERYRMTAIKCLLVGEIKRYVTLKEDELDTYQQLRNVVMKYAINREIEKKRSGNAMDIDAAEDYNDEATNNWTTGGVDMTADYGEWDEWTWDGVDYINKGKGKTKARVVGVRKRRIQREPEGWRQGCRQRGQGDKGQRKDNILGRVLPLRINRAQHEELPIIE